MLNSVKSFVKVASSLNADELSKITSHAIFDACKASDLLHYAILKELQTAFNDDLSSVVASCDYVANMTDSNRDSQSALLYVVSKDTISNISKQLCKIYLKRDLSSHVVINASLKELALKNEVLQKCFDAQHKKCVRFVVADVAELLRIIKLIRALNK